MHSPWSVSGTTVRAGGPKFLVTKAVRVEEREGEVPGWLELVIQLRPLGVCPLPAAGF